MASYRTDQVSSHQAGGSARGMSQVERAAFIRAQGSFQEKEEIQCGWSPGRRGEWEDEKEKREGPLGDTHSSPLESVVISGVPGCIPRICGCLTAKSKCKLCDWLYILSLLFSATHSSLLHSCFSFCSSLQAQTRRVVHLARFHSTQGPCIGRPSDLPRAPPPHALCRTSVH